MSAVLFAWGSGVSELIDDCIKCYSFRVCTGTKVEQQLGSRSQRNSYSGCLRPFRFWTLVLLPLFCWFDLSQIWFHPYGDALICQILMPGVGGVYKPFPLLCLAYLWYDGTVEESQTHSSQMVLFLFDFLTLLHYHKTWPLTLLII